MSNPTSITGAHAPDWESRSRPSKTNCTNHDRDALPSGESTWGGYWWKRKNEIVDQFVEEWSDRASRPVSVRSDVKLREEATAEKVESGRRSASWSSVLNSYLNWYNGYRNAHLVFRDPEGHTVRGHMPNSHQPRYGNKYYARLKALERQAIEQFDDPYVVMLTFTGSTRNDNGGWRCPADHLRDVVESWRPERGRGVYHELRNTLDGQRWEYALVTEKHKSGYGHVHAAVFVDGQVEESDFHSVIDAHLRECQIAGPEAHDYHHPNEAKKPISLRPVDTSVDPDDYEEDGPVGNVASYIGEYIGTYGDGEDLFDRGLHELVFRAAAWATGTQMVRFSNGANELIREDREDTPEQPESVAVPKPEFDPDAENPGETCDGGSPFEVINQGWTIQGVARVDQEGETVYEMDPNGVCYVNIDSADHLDPPKREPFRRPQRRAAETRLNGYES